MKITEKQLRNIIKESVENVLNELNYSTYKSAYDKLKDKSNRGEITKDRVRNFKRTFDDLYNQGLHSSNSIDIDNDRYVERHPGDAWHDAGDSWYERNGDHHKFNSSTHDYDSYMTIDKTQKEPDAPKYKFWKNDEPFNGDRANVSWQLKDKVSDAIKTILQSRNDLIWYYFDKSLPHMSYDLRKRLWHDGYRIDIENMSQSEIRDILLTANEDSKNLSK